MSTKVKLLVPPMTREQLEQEYGAPDRARVVISDGAASREAVVPMWCEDGMIAMVIAIPEADNGQA